MVWLNEIIIKIYLQPFSKTIYNGYKFERFWNCYDQPILWLFSYTRLAVVSGKEFIHVVL